MIQAEEFFLIQKEEFFECNEEGSRDPEAAILALLLPAVAKRVVPAFFKTLARGANQIVASTNEPFRVSKGVLLMFSGGDAPFDTCHDGLLRTVGEHTANALLVALADVCGSFETPFARRRLTLEIVVVRRLSALDASLRGERKAFRGALVRFHLGHLIVLIG